MRRKNFFSNLYKSQPCTGGSENSFISLSVIAGTVAGQGPALWTQSTGWLLVMSLLTERGNNKDLLGWDLTAGGGITGISADGTIIVGDGIDPSGQPEAWMASISLKDPPLETPLPAALPLFATDLGGLGLLGWRRKRKALSA
jgi:hypothetical protein